MTPRPDDPFGAPAASPAAPGARPPAGPEHDPTDGGRPDRPVAPQVPVLGADAGPDVDADAAQGGLFTVAASPATPAAAPAPTATPPAAPGAPDGPGPAPAPARRSPGAPGAGAVGAAPSSAAAGAERSSHGVRTADPLPEHDRARLLEGTHHDPHGLLGAHQAAGGVVVRVLRPFARSVTVVGTGLCAQLHSEGGGLFAGLLPVPEIPDYELVVRYGDTPASATEVRITDPYRFLPAIGEMDLHLFSEGRHEQLWQALGAHPMTHEGVTGTRFTVWAPNAQGVRLTGDFTYWDATLYPMRSLGSSGVWELFVPGVGEGALYKYEITGPDGSRSQRADPMARRTECPPATASVVTSSRHAWRDAEWLERRKGAEWHTAPLSVYEVHLPSWRPGLSYRELAEQLPAYVKDLGFTHVELMPAAEHPFGGSWGYQVTGFYAPTARLGTPDDFRYLIDSLHRAGIGVLMDWVAAHFPKDDWALARFDGTHLYEPADPSRAEHPDWGTLEFDYGRNEVRNFLVANALYWCEEFHIDGLRVDAVASMLYLDYSREEGQWSPNVYGGRENLDAVAFLQEMNATLYRRCPGVLTMAEESTAWDGVTRATHHDGLGFGFKWNMGWMHDSLVYMSKDPVHRRYHHDDMTFSMVYAYSENYILPISHDEVVHGKQALVSKMPGDWWQQRANHRAYLGFMWGHPGKQLLFMGQEFAQGGEWSEATGPDWWLLDPAYEAEPDHRGVRDLVRDLNRLYAATPALWQRDTDPGGFSWIDGGAREDNVFAFLRYDAEGRPLAVVSNMSPVVREGWRIGVPQAGGTPEWAEVLNTDAPDYGGSGVANRGPLTPEAVPSHGHAVCLNLTLPPLSTLWLRPA